MSIIHNDNDGGLVGPDGQPLPKVEEQNVDASETTESSRGEEIEVNFFNYVTSLGFQSMIFMGVIPNPITQQTEKNLKQAKFLIDTLAMIEEKTQGNLTDDEQNILKGSLYELRMKFVEVSKE